ncbi:MAG: transcriptional regulator [Thalassobius sp.]|nr:transcriptional regulator [Thalassovita sp.]
MCQSCIPRIPENMEKAGLFAQQMITMLNHGALVPMISIGHQTKLFDIMDTLDWSTSVEIAECANLNERYVREWLGAMASGRIVEYNPKANTYYLPPENAIFLTRKSNEKNMSSVASLITVWAGVEEKVTRCFKNGGGVPYSEYNGFHEAMGDLSAANVGKNLTEIILPENQSLFDRLENGISILDIGCGDGQVLLALAQYFPKSKFYGIDLCDAPIKSAQNKARIRCLNNITFKQEDLLAYSPTNKYDLITAFDVIHDLAFPDKVLQLVNNWLNDDGTFLMMDINASSHLENNLENPFAPFLYTASTLHCMTVSLAQGGMGLGTVWGKEKAVEMLKEAGFSNTQVQNFEHDLFNNYYFSSK